MSSLAGEKLVVDEPLKAFQWKGIEMVFSHLLHAVAELCVSVVGCGQGVYLGRLCSIWRTGNF